MRDLPDFLASGERARLIPVVADTSKEGRATSILLSTIMSVDDFAKSLLHGIGQRLGARAKIECYTQVVFKKCPADLKIRPDGFLILSIGRRTWSALFEAKIGKTSLDQDQIVKYCELAKLNGVDAVITLSNQLAALPTHHPIKLTKTLARGIDLYHWSWMYVLTQATLLLQDDEFRSAEQRYLLSEMVRYFTHASAGVATFDRMNPEWKDLVVKVQSGAALNKTAPEVENSVAAWHQEERDLCLLMSRKLGRQVTLTLSRAHRNDQVRRLKDDCELLVGSQKLLCILDVPDAAAVITVCADIGRRTVACAMHLAAPKDRKGSKSRINWLLRQLNESNPDNIFIKAIWPGRARDTLAALADLRENPRHLDADNASLVPQHFEVIMVRDLAGKFSGPRTFVEQLESAVPDYYEQVGQHLRAWIPPPPKIVETKPEQTEAGATQSDEPQTQP